MKPTQQMGSPDISIEEYAVFDAILQSLFIREGTDTIVVNDLTMPGHSLSDSARDLPFVQEQLGKDLDQETIEDFMVKNNQQWQVADQFQQEVDVILLTEKDYETIFSDDNGWARFYESYPTSPGIVTFSRVAFNDQMDQALVYVGNQADYLAGEGDYFLLKQEAGKWVIQNMVMVWIS